MDNDFGKLYKPISKQNYVSMKPLGVSNCISSFDRKDGFYSSFPKSSPLANVRKTLFEAKNKENEESTLCKDFSNREVTGKTPIVVPQRLRNGSNSDEAQERTKIKPRRSMLGQRAKNLRPSICKDDSTYTISKPLHSSSPINSNRFDNYKPDSRLQKATSTPTLTHPFDSQDADASSFFTKGMSDSTWSVFKSNKKPDHCEDFPTETPLSRGVILGRPSNAGHMKPSAVVPTADQRMKLERLALKFQQNESLSYYSPKEQTRESYCSEKSQKLKGPPQTTILGARTRGQLKREKEKYLSASISPISEPKQSSEFIRDELEEEPHDSFSTAGKNDLSRDSADDSYVQNEATIVGTCIKKLDDINEESLTKTSISTKINEGEPSDCADHSDEYVSSHDDTVIPRDLNSILTVFKDLQNEKVELDNKLAYLMQQKNSFDKKWDEFNHALEFFLNNTDKSCEKYVKRKPKNNKVICTKGRRSLIMSPRSCLTLTKSKVQSSKNYSDLKKNFSCLKTPLQSVKHAQRLRKSTCYTPNSLSVLVGDQVKDIFGET